MKRVSEKIKKEYKMNNRTIQISKSIRKKTGLTMKTKTKKIFFRKNTELILFSFLNKTQIKDRK